LEKGGRDEEEKAKEKGGQQDPIPAGHDGRM
jgi:hypothetical protein